MSPAHVERFIGSCLITSGYKPPRYRRYPPEYGAAYHQAGWTAGLPLIAAVTGRKKEDRSPLSRLAIHTQGAPLIQSGRGGQSRRPAGKPQADHRKPPPASPPKEVDEPTNSENSLPRIIKPRKRRKKERKPQQESAIVTLKPYTPLCSELPPPVEREPVAPVPEDSDRVAECQCRYCDPLGVIWEARAPAAWPNEDLTVVEESSTTSGSGLEVSSEIVTSPNGHRDIEIRFFTTPPPPQPRPQPVVVSPPWR